MYVYAITTYAIVFKTRKCNDFTKTGRTVILHVGQLVPRGRTDKPDTLRSLGLGRATGGLPSVFFRSLGMGGACLMGGLV